MSQLYVLIIEIYTVATWSTLVSTTTFGLHNEHNLVI